MSLAEGESIIIQKIQMDDVPLHDGLLIAARTRKGRVTRVGYCTFRQLELWGDSPGIKHGLEHGP